MGHLKGFGMKVLVTSGGTKVPIDPVRDVTNKSRGTFGSKIAAAFLWAGQEVLFMHAKHSKTPMSMTVDFKNPESLEEAKILFNWCYQYQKKYQEVSYVTFDQYTQELEYNIKLWKPDIVVLAAAVSDYKVKNVSNAKVRSKDDFHIELEHAPKLIGRIKEWLPSAFLVGFKLLVDVTDEELIKAATESIEKNGCDLVVANEFNKVLAGNHEILLVDKEIRLVKENQAKEIVKRVLELKS